MPSLFFFVVVPIYLTKDSHSCFSLLQGWYIFRHSEPKSWQRGQQWASHGRQVFIQGHELPNGPTPWWLFSQVGGARDSGSWTPPSPAGSWGATVPVSLPRYPVWEALLLSLFLSVLCPDKEKEENHPLQEGVLEEPVTAIVPSTPHVLFPTPPLTWGPQTWPVTPGAYCRAVASTTTVRRGGAGRATAAWPTSAGTTPSRRLTALLLEGPRHRGSTQVSVTTSRWTQRPSLRWDAFRGTAC